MDTIPNGRASGHGKNGVPSATQPPASTLLADRIVAAHAESSDQVQRERYLQLLEVSTSLDESGQPTIGTDAASNLTLILIIFKAGLDRFVTAAEPFNTVDSDNNVYIDQSIEVIRLALIRSPGVLLHVSDSNALSDALKGVPLFVWLIPKLLAICHSLANSYQNVDTAIWETLTSIVALEPKCSKNGQYCTAISSFLRDLISDVLFSLEETTQLLSNQVKGPQRISISDQHGLFTTFLAKIGLPSPPINAQFEIGSAASAIKVACLSLKTLFTTKSSGIAGPMAVKPLLSWCLDSLRRLWDSCQAFPNLVNDGEPLVPLFLESLQPWFLPMQSMGMAMSMSQKAFLIWADVVAHCISQFVDKSGEVSADTLYDVLEQTRTLFSLRLKGVSFLRQSLLQPLQTLAQDLQHLGTDANAINDLVAKITQIANLPGSCPVEDEFVLEGRPSKRPRLAEDITGTEQLTFRSQLIRALWKTIKAADGTVLEDLPAIAPNLFKKLSQDEQCEVLRALSKVACALGTSDATHDSGGLCPTCDSAKPPRSIELLSTDNESAFMFDFILRIYPSINKSSKCRVASLLAVRKVLMHSHDIKYLKLAESPIGELCLQSLKSSLRELRIAATHALTAFLTKRNGLPFETVRENRILLLDFLASMYAKNDPPTQETCIFALEQIALVSGDEELNIVLLRLVEYLGHPNQYISGLVFAQLQNLAQSLEMPLAVLFRPYWRTVAVVVVKNLQSRPIIADSLCRLLGMGLEGLLMMTEEFTLPYLVLTRKHDIVRRIAQAHGPDMSAYELCTQTQNLAAILAYLISQPSSDAEQLATTLLEELAPEFKGREIAVWIKMEPIQIACGLLKNVVDAGEGKAARAHQAIHLLATLDSRKSGHGSGSRRSGQIGAFLENHVLGITTMFASTLTDGQVIEPNVEKRRCLAAIGELLKLGKSRLNTALPQICACLRSALDNAEICDQAFKSWADMIQSLDANDVEPLVDQTVAIIVQYWDSFQSSTQERAHALISHILKNHTDMIRQIFAHIPSMASIPIMKKFEGEIGSLKKQMDVKHHLLAFSERTQSETVPVVDQALRELSSFLELHQDYIYRSILGEQSDLAAVTLSRSVIDCCAKFNNVPTIAINAARCLGLIGCLDPNRHESIREKKEILILSNFVKADETSEFVLASLENVLVNAFLSASNTRSQGLLAWAMQELLEIAGLAEAVNSRKYELNDKYKRWLAMPEVVRNTLTPFLTSRYTIAAGNIEMKCAWPVFAPENVSHGQWLRMIVLDMLQVCPNDNAKLIYSAFARVVRGQDLSIPTFLLPFVAQTLIIGGTEQHKAQLLSEILLVLNRPLSGDHQTKENIKSCSESVFQVIEYLSTWVHRRRKLIQSLTAGGRADTRNYIDSPDDARQQIELVESLLQQIPPEVISRRAVECKSYSRALFHWEQYIRRVAKPDQGQEEHDDMLMRMQEIYTQIDEPDGIEGISAQLIAPNLGRQILEHRKAGRWTAAQRWYELELDEHPEDPEIQISLLSCLKESGQFDVLLNQYESLRSKSPAVSLLPYAVEAAWATGKWAILDQYLQDQSSKSGDFNIGIGSAIQALAKNDIGEFEKTIDGLRQSLGESLNMNNTTSLQSCHDHLLRFHVVTEIAAIAGSGSGERAGVLQALDRRLDVLGAYVSDKQYLLGLRRAAMQLAPGFSSMDAASTWLTSAKLARKSGSIDQALHAVLHATHLGDKSASIEHARLLWKEGQHRRAIQTLEGAIDSGAFRSHNVTNETSSVTLTADQQQEQNLVTARAHLLLAKWLDIGGQTQSDVIIRSYKKATDFHRRWDKGHYYLGKHYNKLIDSEKTKPIGKESPTYLTGEMAKIVIDNYLRAAMLGSKYVFQTLPKVLTLWMELVEGVDQPPDARRGNERFNAHTLANRKRVVDEVNAQMKKYVERIPAYSLYTILSQIVARIVHPNATVYGNMVSLIVKVVRAYPQQAMWTVLAVVKSSNKERASRGLSILSKIVESQKKGSKEPSSADLKALIMHGQKLSDELLRVSDYHIEGKASRVSLSRDLGFNHKIAPSRLVVPTEANLIPSLPSNLDATALKNFKAFPKDAVTISSFLDEALVLSSLQKPRKMSIRGSDGRVYGILAKPKDDLRKDQRLMEFNTMINRFLKRDVDASKRRLYIRTYSVIPLNEECGLLEWVDNLKTFRDILLKIYKEKGTVINYMEIRNLLDEACAGDASKLDIFDKRVLKMFPPVFHEWFVETFPDPSSWFASRLRYTRSAAVMSMVGHVLGLGDRHGENILFEEDNGGTLHVDFNCLFDKGLTFEKPEMVPFRLTHNMIDAFGPYGYDGPFRRSAEITLQLLRANEEALMTILETFLHDPTTDFIGGKKKRGHPLVPDTPMGVLDGVRGKVRGLLPGESVALSIEGYVEEMIKMATDRKRLAAMYIGWCAFF